MPCMIPTASLSSEREGERQVSEIRMRSTGTIRWLLFASSSSAGLSRSSWWISVVVSRMMPSCGGCWAS
eukprot:1078803-Alexandrium_andersonii.AAC.1